LKASEDRKPLLLELQRRHHQVRRTARLGCICLGTSCPAVLRCTRSLVGAGPMMSRHSCFSAWSRRRTESACSGLHCADAAAPSRIPGARTYVRMHTCHQHRPPLREFQRRHHQIRCAVAPGCLELERHLSSGVGQSCVGSCGDPAFAPSNAHRDQPG